MYRFWWKPNTQSISCYLWAVTCDGDVIPSFTHSHGLILSTKAYIKSVGELVPLWIERVVPRRPYIWQQDSGLNHTVSRTQHWLSTNICDHMIPNIWSPNSLNFNPLDLYAWGTLKIGKANITGSVTILNKETVGKACRTFPSRPETGLKPMAISLN